MGIAPSDKGRTDVTSNRGIPRTSNRCALPAHYAPVRTKGNAAEARATRLLTATEASELKRRAWSALVPA